MSFCIIIY